MVSVADLDYDHVIEKLNEIKSVEKNMEKLQTGLVDYEKHYNRTEEGLREIRNIYETYLAQILLYRELKKLDLFGLKRGSREKSKFCGYIKEELYNVG